MDSGIEENEKEETEKLLQLEEKNVNFQIYEDKIPAHYCFQRGEGTRLYRISSLADLSQNTPYILENRNSTIIPDNICFKQPKHTKMQIIFFFFDNTNTKRIIPQGFLFYSYKPNQWFYPNETIVLLCKIERAPH